MVRPVPPDAFSAPTWAVRASGLVSMMPEPRVLPRHELRALDRAATDELGIPSAVLMENAAIHASSVIATVAEIPADRRVLIVAGAGNNGGDGLALARQLVTLGFAVEVLVVGCADRLAPDTAMNLGSIRDSVSVGFITPDAPAHDAAATAQATIRRLAPGIIVDAIFGTGLSRAIQGAAAGLVSAIHGASKQEPGGAPGPRVIALDIPSGLDADTGSALTPCVRADLTITFAACKAGFGAVEAQAQLGTIAIVPIGTPPGLTARFGVPLELTPDGRWRHADPRGSEAPRRPLAAGRTASNREGDKLPEE